MKKINLMLMVLAIVMFGCMNEEKKEEQTSKQDEKVIGKPVVTLKSDLMTPELLWSFGRIGEVALSPDKKTIVYGVKYFDIQDNKGNTDFYSMTVDGKDVKQITSTPKSEFNMTWRPDGKKLGFIYGDANGAMQMWEMNPDGTERVQITTVADGITGFKYSPDMSKILFTKDIDLVEHVVDKYPDLPKANARIMTDLMYRHWDSWIDSYSHIFVADYKEGTQIEKGTDLMEKDQFDSPNKPFGGMEQITWSPDSKTIAYVCVKKVGKAYATSTNSDIYFYNLDSKETVNKTEGMMGYDVNPVFSPDGKKMAWESMEHDGYESDKQRLFVLDLQSGTKTDFSKDFDQNSNGLEWADDSKSIYFVSDWHATDEIYCLNLESTKIKKITEGVHNYMSVLFAGNTLIATQQSMSAPTEIFAVNVADGKETQISTVNNDLLGKLAIATVESRWVKTSDNKDMQVWVIYPPHFDKTKKYPTLLFCEGGPQSTVSQFWSYRWNMQIMAANGYIVVAPNRRGLPGFGYEWLKQISGDYGGQNMKDYLSAIDAVAAEPFVNKDKLGCVGASYGGFSVYWLAGHHNKRFKAFISHDGMFNLESQYLETEEMWFVNWDLGGAFWEKDNKVAQNSYANSPHRFVDKWDAPIMVVHGELDYRISYTQGMQAFNAAVLRGIPAKYLHFPTENHWVLQPQNGILWQREYFAWLDKWLK